MKYQIKIFRVFMFAENRFDLRNNRDLQFNDFFNNALHLKLISSSFLFLKCKPSFISAGPAARSKKQDKPLKKMVPAFQ